MPLLGWPATRPPRLATRSGANKLRAIAAARADSNSRAGQSDMLSDRPWQRVGIQRQHFAPRVVSVNVVKLKKR
jgi:hypothetical protein